MLTIKIPGPVSAARVNRPEDAPSCPTCGFSPPDHFEHNPMTEEGIRRQIGSKFPSCFYDLFDRSPRHAYGRNPYNPGKRWKGVTPAMVLARIDWIKRIVAEWGKSSGLPVEAVEAVKNRLADPHRVWDAAGLPGGFPPPAHHTGPRTEDRTRWWGH